MPREVKDLCDAEDKEYNRYSQHTAKGEKKGLLKAARVLKGQKTISDAEITTKLDLTEAEVADIKID